MNRNQLHDLNKGNIEESLWRGIDLSNFLYLFMILYVSRSFYLYKLSYIEKLSNPESSQTTYHAQRFPSRSVSLRLFRFSGFFLISIFPFIWSYILFIYFTSLKFLLFCFYSIDNDGKKYNKCKQDREY